MARRSSGYTLSIYRRKTKSDEVRHIVRYRLGGRAYPLVHGGSFKTAREAKIRRDLIAGELAAGRNPAAVLVELRRPPVQVEIVTLRERFDDFIASRHDVSASTLALYRNARDKLGELEERDPATLKPGDFVSWIGANVRSDENP